MRQLSLDSLTLTNATPEALIRAAAGAGFDRVSLSVQPPGIYPDMLVTPDRVRESERALADTGITVHTIEFFDLASRQAVRESRAALEIGSRLGARAALALHIGDVGRDEAADLLASFAELAEEHGLATMFEPVAMGRTATLADACELIRMSGTNTRIVLDVWHLVYTGGIAQLAGLDPAMIGYVQLNDGCLAISPADQVRQVIRERPYPGEGEFPIADILRRVPPDVPVGIEAPSLRRARAGMSAAAQAAEAMAAVRRALAADVTARVD